MKILDRYIIQTFLVSLAISLAAMMGVTLLMDLLINVNKFLDLSSVARKLGFWPTLAGIGNYYFYRAFDYFQYLAGPSLLVAAAASLVRLNRGRELVGVKAAGVSLYRVMWPMIVVGLLADGFFIANQELIIPRIAIQLSRDPDDVEVQTRFSVDFVRDDNNNILFAPFFDPPTQTLLATALYHDKQGKLVAVAMDDPVVQDLLARNRNEVDFPAKVRIFLRDPKYELRGVIAAEKAQWDPKLGGWRLTNGVRLPPPSEPPVLDHIPVTPEGEPLDFYSSNVGPNEISRHRATDFYRYMAYSELRSVAEDPMRGNRRQLQVAMHEHVTLPILNVLLLLLGLPFVAGREDRNYFTGIGVAVLLTIGMFAFRFTCTAFGNAGHITPLLAAWLPVFVALPASVISMESLKT